jgi:hypothetical protein
MYIQSCSFDIKSSPIMKLAVIVILIVLGGCSGKTDTSTSYGSLQISKCQFFFDPFKR